MVSLSCDNVLQLSSKYFFFQAEDGIRDHCVTGVQTCALPICRQRAAAAPLRQHKPTPGQAPPPQYGHARGAAGRRDTSQQMSPAIAGLTAPEPPALTGVDRKSVV